MWRWEVTGFAPFAEALRAGEVFCLVGQSGSGKTTLAMIAAGVLDSDQGHRVFDGRDMDEWRDRDYRSLASRIGVVCQNPAEAVSHRPYVFDIVAEPLGIQGLAGSKGEVRQRVKRALADVQLSTEQAFMKRSPTSSTWGPSSGSASPGR